MHLTTITLMRTQWKIYNDEDSWDDFPDSSKPQSPGPLEQECDESEEAAVLDAMLVSNTMDSPQKNVLDLTLIVCQSIKAAIGEKARSETLKMQRK